MRSSASLAVTAFAILMTSAAVQAQTSYPMVMSLKPVAIQAGQTAELTVSSRYTMFGATDVQFTGEGLFATPIMPEVAEGKDPPNLQKMAMEVTATADAAPGVRTFRMLTPNGVSTLGQIVVVRDPVFAESAKNDTLETAEEVTIPASVCGAIERNEDVDFFRFHVEAGTTLCFHVRAQRLQDAIHDLQTHIDPIMTLRSAGGGTLAMSDNAFFADPFLCHTFDTAGDYVLEIRDVRYTGNQYWEYCIEISDRPFVQVTYPTAISTSEETTVELIGAALPEGSSYALSADGLSSGQIFERNPVVGEQLLNPVSFVAVDGPVVAETADENESPETAQLISLPVTVNGRIGSPADVDCFKFEATKGDRLIVETFARRVMSNLDPIVRILNIEGKPLSENDDSRAGLRLTSDSKIENWTVPADGTYVIEIRDLHLRGGVAFPYGIRVTQAEPDFFLSVDTDKTLLAPGTSAAIFVRADRKNGFAGAIDLQIDGLPDGVLATCGRILEGKARDGCIVLECAEDATPDMANVRIGGVARIEIADAEPIEISVDAVPYQETYMPGGGRGHWPSPMHTVSIGTPGDIRKLELSTYDVVLKPGESQTIDVTIERAEGFDKNVTLDMLYRHLNSVYADSLPPGVTLESKSSTVLAGKKTQGQLILTAAKDAAPVEKQVTAVMANIALNFVMKSTSSSRPLFVTVAPAE